MKKLSVLALSFAAFAAVFTSCKKDDSESPVITINNADSAVVAAGSQYVITGTVTDNEEISSIAAFQVTTSGETQLSKITEFEDKTSTGFSFTITNITATTIIKITATDANDNQTSKNFKLIVNVVADLTSVTFAEAIGAGDSPKGSYVDLETGEVFGYSEINSDATKKAAVDAVFNLASLYNTGNGLSGATGTKFGSTTLDAAGFAAAKEDALTGLTAGLDEITVAEGKVIYFETAAKKGLILIKTYTPSSLKAGGNAEITIEVKLKNK